MGIFDCIRLRSQSPPPREVLSAAGHGANGLNLCGGIASDADRLVNDLPQLALPSRAWAQNILATLDFVQQGLYAQQCHIAVFSSKSATGCIISASALANDAAMDPSVSGHGSAILSTCATQPILLEDTGLLWASLQRVGGRSPVLLPCDGEPEPLLSGDSPSAAVSLRSGDLLAMPLCIRGRLAGALLLGWSGADCRPGREPQPQPQSQPQTPAKTQKRPGGRRAAAGLSKDPSAAAAPPGAPAAGSQPGADGRRLSAEDLRALQRMAHFVLYGIFAQPEQAEYLEQVAEAMICLQRSSNVQQLVGGALLAVRDLLQCRTSLELTPVMAVVHGPSFPAALFALRDPPSRSSTQCGLLTHSGYSAANTTAATHSMAAAAGLEGSFKRSSTGVPVFAWGSAASLGRPSIPSTTQQGGGGGNANAAAAWAWDCTGSAHDGRSYQGAEKIQAVQVRAVSAPLGQTLLMDAVRNHPYRQYDTSLYSSRQSYDPIASSSYQQLCSSPFNAGAAAAAAVAAGAPRSSLLLKLPSSPANSVAAPRPSLLLKQNSSLGPANALRRKVLSAYESPSAADMLPHQSSLLRHAPQHPHPHAQPVQSLSLPPQSQPQPQTHAHTHTPQQMQQPSLSPGFQDGAVSGAAAVAPWPAPTFPVAPLPASAWLFTQAFPDAAGLVLDAASPCADVQLCGRLAGMSRVGSLVLSLEGSPLRPSGTAGWPFRSTSHHHYHQQQQRPQLHPHLLHQQQQHQPPGILPAAPSTGRGGAAAPLDPPLPIPQMAVYLLSSEVLPAGVLQAAALELESLLQLLLRTCHHTLRNRLLVEWEALRAPLLGMRPVSPTPQAAPAATPCRCPSPPVQLAPPVPRRAVTSLDGSMGAPVPPCGVSQQQRQHKETQLPAQQQKQEQLSGCVLADRSRPRSDPRVTSAGGAPGANGGGSGGVNSLFDPRVRRATAEPFQVAAPLHRHPALQESTEEGDLPIMPLGVGVPLPLQLPSAPSRTLRRSATSRPPTYLPAAGALNPGSSPSRSGSGSGSTSGKHLSSALQFFSRRLLASRFATASAGTTPGTQPARTSSEPDCISAAAAAAIVGSGVTLPPAAAAPRQLATSSPQGTPPPAAPAAPARAPAAVSVVAVAQVTDVAVATAKVGGTAGRAACSSPFAEVLIDCDDVQSGRCCSSEVCSGGGGGGGAACSGAAAGRCRGGAGGPSRQEGMESFERCSDLVRTSSASTSTSLHLSDIGNTTHGPPGEEDDDDDDDDDDDGEGEGTAGERGPGGKADSQAYSTLLDPEAFCGEAMTGGAAGYPGGSLKPNAFPVPVPRMLRMASQPVLNTTPTLVFESAAPGSNLALLVDTLAATLHSAAAATAVPGSGGGGPGSVSGGVPLPLLPMSYRDEASSCWGPTSPGLLTSMSAPDAARGTLERSDLRALQLLEPLGRGGQGVVLRGCWGGLPAAVKCIVQPVTTAASASWGSRSSAGEGVGPAGGCSGGGAVAHRSGSGSLSSALNPPPLGASARMLRGSPGMGPGGGGGGGGGAGSFMDGRGPGGLGLGGFIQDSAAEEVAAKQDKRRQLRCAWELAVTPALSHPNIVQSYGVFTDLVIVRVVERYRTGSTKTLTHGSSPQPQQGPQQQQQQDDGKVHMRLVHSSDPSLRGAAHGAPLYSVLCLEFCDAGTLLSASRSGAFRAPLTAAAPQPPQHAQPAPTRQPAAAGDPQPQPSREQGVGAAPPDGAGTAAGGGNEGAASAPPALVPLYTSLLEVALALRHMHGRRLVHADIKPSNVLLKSSTRDPRGWTCKLSDFGCARLLSEVEVAAGGMRQAYPSGTLPYMAPELLTADGLQGFPSDIYAFGILMWELLAARQPYYGVDAARVPGMVLRQSLRPSFDRTAPPDFVCLATQCWARPTSARPTAAQVVERLQVMLTRARSSVDMHPHAAHR